MQASIETIRKFCQARNWDQFHSPKDLAIGLVTEASELLELFRFRSTEEADTLMKDPEFRQKVGAELADVFFFLLRFCERQNFDLLKEFDEKMTQNALRYPVEKFKGSNKKYNE